MVASKKDFSFVIELLKRLDKRDYAFIDSLTDEQLKEIQPFTLLRWFSCVPDQSGLSLYQLLVSQQFNTKCPNDKKILLKMIASSGCLRELRHQWIKPVLQRKRNNKIHDIIKELLNINDLEVEKILDRYNDEQIIDLLHTFGIQDSEINKLY